MTAAATRSPHLVTPAHLSPAQKELLVAISGRKCAWRLPNGWRPKGNLNRFELRTAGLLVSKGLAEVHYGKGPDRLEATYSGELLATEIKRLRRK